MNPELLTANTLYLHQKKVDIHIAQKNLHWFVRKSKGFEEVVSQKIMQHWKSFKIMNKHSTRLLVAHKSREYKKENKKKHSIDLSLAGKISFALVAITMVTCHTYFSTNSPHRSMTGFTTSSHSFPVFLPCFHLSNSKISLCTLRQVGHSCAWALFFWLLFFRSEDVGVTPFELLSTCGHSGSRYAHVATRSASSRWIKRSVQHTSSLSLSQIGAFGLTQAVAPRCLFSCLHSTLHKASFPSVIIRFHNSRVKSSQYLLL